MSFGIPTRNGLSLGLGAVPTLATNFGLPIPSLSLDYTIPSDGTPGVVPGFYQVDNGFGVLTQTTFSSLITFSRASNATRFSPTGQLEYAPHNLLLQSQNFTTSWTSPNTDVTSDTTLAPDGTTTADTVSDDATNDVHVLSQTIAISGQVTFSVFAKNGSGSRYLTIGVNSATSNYATATFDLSTQTSTQTLIAGYGGAVTTNVSASAEGFYRYSMTVTTATASNARIGLSNTSTFANFSRGFDRYVGNGSSIILWGAQLTVGPNALDYTPTTTAVVYGPRFDYDPTTLAAKGLLIEEQRTNLVLYSEQFDNAVWTKTRSSITSNTVVAPDGTLTGDALITDTTVTDTHRIELLSVAFTSGTTYTLTLFAKAQSSLNLQLVFLTAAFGISLRAAFNLQTGQTLVSSSSITAKTTNVGNGWFRCEATATATATATSGFHISLINTFAATAAATSFTGDGTSGIYIWGAQLEAGAFATSYIPTTTAATTRSADIASIGTLSPWYNATEGTLYGEGSWVGLVASRFAVGLNNSASASADFISIQTNPTTVTTGRGGVTAGGVTQAAMNITNAYTASVLFKAANAYQQDNFGFTVNGATPASDTSGTVPTVDRMQLGAIGTTTANIWIRRITYTPRRLTDAELQSLTS
tara:strand:- start:428 stop:2359 length:1932 start_codon:yes stop_codon:yes gene_type:complete